MTSIPPLSAFAIRCWTDSGASDISSALARTICNGYVRHRLVEATNDGDTFYRSATAEYTREWYGLRNLFNLNAAAITGNVTWSMQGSAWHLYRELRYQQRWELVWDYICLQRHRYEVEEFMR